MLRLLLFLKRHLHLLLFILLEAGALYVYANSTSYAQARILTFSNTCISGLLKGFSGVTHYFSLAKENRELTQKIEELNNIIENNYLTQDTTTYLSFSTNDTIIAPYYYTSAEVIRNTISKKDNYFVINKGRRDGIMPDMAVLTPTGMAVGYVMECTERFSICMSALNSKFNLGGILKNKDYFGFLEWKGEDYRHIVLNDIPVYADVAKGDTILSTISFRFPPNILIGTVEDFKISDDITNYKVKIRLAADFGRLRNVIIVKYNNANELKDVENKISSLENQ